MRAAAAAVTIAANVCVYKVSPPEKSKGNNINFILVILFAARPVSACVVVGGGTQHTDLISANLKKLVERERN